MSDIVVKVENLSKKYVIGHQRTEGYQTFRDSMAAQVKGWGRRLIHPFRNSEGGLKVADEKEEFYALNGVSFEIKQGDRVGIIGRNGAGKSTLLKILSRITEPTSGRIEIDGRVASLLEVGTGFHPELSGRENIFLNGAILGMAKAEIRRKFDEIVAFAEIEKFLDTPVKRYSSGMYVRLAFAVAAHLEPEILIVDEVLAVGDAQFQKKCLGKMEEVSTRERRTVLFVSHNMDAVNRLCKHGVFLQNGKIKFYGKASDSIRQYMHFESIEQHSDYDYPEPEEDVDAYITKFCFENIDGTKAQSFPVGKPWQARVFFQVRRFSTFLVAFGMHDKSGLVLRSTWTERESFVPGSYYVLFRETDLMLTPGSYPFYLHLHRSKGQNMFSLLNAGCLQVEDIRENLSDNILNHNWGIVVNQLKYEFGKC